jgi:hypothetical protein
MACVLRNACITGRKFVQKQNPMQNLSKATPLSSALYYYKLNQNASIKSVSGQNGGKIVKLT